MWQLNSVEINKVGVYQGSEPTSFNFDTGISLIIGENGAGKSSLTNTLPTILFSEPPTARKKNSAGTMHKQNSWLNLNMNNGDDDYIFRQIGTKSGCKLQIIKNGQNQEFQTIALAKKALQEIFQLKQSHFYCLHYLSMLRNHPLIMASGPSRHDVFESLFDMQLYEAIQKVLGNRLSDLNKKNIEFQTLQKQEQEIDQESISTLQENKKLLNNCKNRLNEIQDTSQIWSIEQQQLIAYVSIAQELTNDKDSILQDKILQEKNKEASIEKQIETIQKAQVYTEQRTELLAIRKELQPQICISVKTSIKVKELYTKYKDLLEKYKNYCDLEQPEKPSIIVKNAFEEISIVKSKLQEITESLASLSGIKEHVECPTCFQRIGKKHITKLEHDWKNIQGKLEKRLEILYICKNWNDYKKVVDQYNLPSIKPKFWVKVSVLLECLKQEYKRSQENAKILQEITSIDKQLEKIPIVDTMVDLETLKKLLAECQKNISDLNRQIQLRQRLSELDLSTNLVGAKNRLEVLSSKLPNLQKKVSKLTNDLTNLTRLVTTGNIEKKRWLGIVDKLTELENEIKSIPILKTLFECYGARGLKTIQVASIAKRYEMNLNRFSSLLYPYPISFNINVDKTNFEILATRPNKDKNSWDVSMLSGAENRQFQLLTLISLLPLTQTSHRLDTCILDEISSGMSITSRERFVSEFVPQLQSIIPKIILIEPIGQNFYIPEAHNYRVEMKNNCSKLLRVS